MKPLAKSSNPPIFLDDHTRNVIEQVEIILTSRPFVSKKYNELTNEDLLNNTKESARWHDEGKKDLQWQTACQEDHNTTKLTGKDSSRHLMRVGVRHELISLVEMARSQTNIPLSVKVAVAAHHGKLSHRHQARWQERPTFPVHWKEFMLEASSLRTRDRDAVEQAIWKRYVTSGPRALLQMADHRASAIERGDQVPGLNLFSYQFPHTEKRGVQRTIEDLWDEPFAILRAPTGAGKTDAALLWAQRQIACNRADRLVIAMPTRFTANSLAISTAETLSTTGLYHSSAWYQRIKDRPLTIMERKFIDKEQELAYKLETPVTVTTVDHLCIALTSTREAHHAIFFGLAHSCVVIDEADFYDGFTQQNIVVLLRTLKRLGVPVLLMSATVPESARQIYTMSGFEPKCIFEDNTRADQPRYEVKRYGKVECPENIELLLRRALDGEPTIIYANTVKRAQLYYRWFAKKIAEGGTQLLLEDVILYHSRFTEPDKVEKENRLQGCLGKHAWDRGQERGVAILTQIGEISVNISANLMISDLCPIDRLAQRAGRLSRFHNYSQEKHTLGQLFIVLPQQINKKTSLPEMYPAPYGHYDLITKTWQSNEAFHRSDGLLEDGVYSAKTFVNKVNQLYPVTDQVDIASHIKNNKRELEKLIVGNWLILPKEELEQNDEQTTNWKSRDIPLQYTIFTGYDVEKDDSSVIFDNRNHRREFQIRHGIQCYAWEFNTAIKNQWLKQVTCIIRDEEETLYFVLPSHYDGEMGLCFEDDTEDE